MAAVYCENQNKRRKIDLRRAAGIIRKVLRDVGKDDFAVNLVFVSNQKIRAINRRYLGIDRATDVIAFPAEDEKDGFVGPKGQWGKGAFLGDIVISSDKAFQNSVEYSTGFAKEAALYVIHGILHLSGYDDTTRSGRLVMRRKENDLLQKIKSAC